MAQQINLYVPELRAPRRMATARQALAVAVLVVCGGGSASALLHWQAHEHAQRGAALQQQGAQLQLQVAARQASAPTTRVSTQEVERLRQMAAAQLRVQQALAGAPEAGAQPSDYLLAFARQAQASVWLTGFSLTGADRALEIRGRMLDASVLPDYLRRLNAEPRFKGRSFAQLEIRATPLPGEPPSPYPEFVLRSTVPPGSATPATNAEATK